MPKISQNQEKGGGVNPTHSKNKNGKQVPKTPENITITETKQIYINTNITY